VRHSGKRISAALSALSMLPALAVPAVLAPPAAQAAPPVASLAGQPYAVTLVTGDRVLLDLAGGQERVVTVDAGEGRDGMAFMQQIDRGDLYVLPADAAPLVAAGRVDRRLFNVSKLREFGYGDRDQLPLIVTHQRGSAARSALSAAGGEVVRELPSIGGAAVEVDRAGAGDFWDGVTGAQPQTLSAGLTRVWLDGRVSASLDASVPQVGAPEAWQAGHTGEGAVVAVLDSGIDTDHPDLAGTVVAAHDFTGSESGTDDRYGHGTHVAGIITGSGAGSGGRYQGVAPDASLLNGKVLDDFGDGTESGIIAGMQWAVAQGADVVNLSLGNGFQSGGDDPMDRAVNTLTRESGTLFVVAAGNIGPDARMLESPGTADEALTVGAADKQDELAEFSSRGPRWGDLALKPDITAPGVDIVAPLAGDSLFARFLPIVDDGYVSLSGTSMATPHVAGAAAILAAQHPGWDAGELKPALMGSAEPRDGLTVHEQGAGRLDVARASGQPVFAAVPNVDSRVVRWPHEDDQPIGRTVIYHNDGPTAVELALAVDIRDPQGNPAPAGMFTLDSDRITVPAGGAAAVELVTDTSVPAPDGTYAGLLTATGDQAVVRTPVGVTREEESYDVTLTFLDRDGQPTPDYMVRFVEIDTPNAIVPYDPSGTVVARVPAGPQYFEATIGDLSVPELEVSLVVEPALDITGDLTLVVDAREAQPVGIALDRPTARPGQAMVVFDRLTDWGDTGTGWVIGDFEGFFTRPSTTAAPGEFTFFVVGDLAEPDGAGGFAGSPYLYHIEWTEDGRVPAELVRRIRDRDLATVRTRIASSAPDQIATKDWVVEVPTPATITERYTPGMDYWPSVGLRAPDAEDMFDTNAFISSGPVTYQRGEPVVERWNAGVFGPSFSEESLIGREGDALGFDLALFGDPVEGRWGWSDTDSVEATLTRDGTQIGEWSRSFGELTVPAEPGTYRLAMTTTRSVSALSTQITVAWTFRSGQTAEFQPLPAMAVRFAPNVDEHNRARSGVPFVIPVRVQPQPGAEVGRLRTLKVQVSYDDGESWRPVPVLGRGLERTVLLFHPRGDGFVSLRATAVDSRGNTVEQTIIHAYALRR
jgi:subtilisin family serine protease